MKHIKTFENMSGKFDPNRVYTFGEDISKEPWTPKNVYQLQALYEPYLKEAYEKIFKMPEETQYYVMGSGFDDKPPRKGAFISVRDSVPNDILELLKKEIENNFITIEVKDVPKFI